MSIRDTVIDVIRKLPADASIHDIAKEIELVRRCAGFGDRSGRPPPQEDPGQTPLVRSHRSGMRLLHDRRNPAAQPFGTKAFSEPWEIWTYDFEDNKRTRGLSVTVRVCQS